VQAARLRARDVGDGEICLLGVDRRPPFDAPERAALAGAVLPDHLAAFLWIQRETDTRFLSDDDDVLPAGQGCEHRRAAEIVVGPVGLRTAGIPRTAIAQIHVVRRDLPHPSDLAGPEIGGGNFLSDTSPEDKAAELRSMSDVHYKSEAKS